MPRTPYDWGKGPAEIEPHSLAKHTILREYVERYVDILMKSGGAPELRLTVVDGFAGGGEYVMRGQGGRIHDGSPPLLINAVTAAAARINLGRKKPIEVDASFVFIEKDRAAFAHLERALAARFDKGFLDKKVRRIRGAFEDHLWDIVHEIKTAPGRRPRPIFVLDQYGHSQVPVDMIAGIMSQLEKAEIFLTLAVDYISDYAPSLSAAREVLRSSLHVPPMADDFISGKMDIDGLMSLGEEDRAAIMGEVQRRLHEAFAKHAGARCYTPFFITSKDSRKSYWFLHLANSSRANDVVKELHWKVANAARLEGRPGFRHHGRAGTRMMLGFDPLRSQGQLAFDFGDSDQDRTINALIEELPQLLRDKYSRGVSLKDLYADICNETPASKLILGQALNALCSVGELTKQGEKGEERGDATPLRDGDVVQPGRVGRLFSTPQLLGSRRPKR